NGQVLVPPVIADEQDSLAIISVRPAPDALRQLSAARDLMDGVKCAQVELLLRLDRGFGGGKPPRAVECLLARPVKANRVIPTLHDGQVVGLTRVASEMNRNAAIPTMLC